MSARFSTVDNMLREVVNPAPNGVTMIFYTLATYRTGSVRVYVNGILYAPSQATELGGNAVGLRIAPATNDTVECIYQVT